MLRWTPPGSSYHLGSVQEPAVAKMAMVAYERQEFKTQVASLLDLTHTPALGKQFEYRNFFRKKRNNIVLIYTLHVLPAKFDEITRLMNENTEVISVKSKQ